MRRMCLIIGGVVLALLLYSSTASVAQIRGGASGTTLTDCASLAAAQSDETGTCGGVVLSNAPVFVGSIDLGAAGVRLSGADGVLTLLSLGNGNNENLVIDLDNEAANVVGLSSGTGVTELHATKLNLRLTGATSNDFLLITSTGNISYSSNGLGQHYALFGDSTGSSGPTWLKFGSDALVSWQSTTRADAGSPDTGLSRIGAGVLGAGTGAQGSTAGTFRGSYQSSDGSAGVTGSSCTAWKNGLCTSS